MKSQQFPRIRICAIAFVTLVHLLCTGLSARAEEKLPTLRVGTVVYTNVTIIRVTATDVHFTFNKGMANAKLKNLEPAMQKHFNYNAEKAEAIMAAQKAAVIPLSLGAGSTNEVVVTPSNASAVKEQAIARVKAIVNQPVKQFPATPSMQVSVYSPGWFHDGAIEPDYATVDVRSTQKTEYGKDAYVSSALNPGVAFSGPELEFNLNTKFFYTDRTLPKKRLSEAEMEEINRLYRVIAKCREASQSGAGPADVVQANTVLAAGFVTAHRKEFIIGTGGFLVLLVLLRSVAGRRSQAG